MGRFKHFMLAALAVLGMSAGALAQSVWTSRTSGTAENLNGVVWTGSQFVAVCTGGNIRTSLDGLTWTTQVSGTTTTLNSVTWADTSSVSAIRQLVAVGLMGGIRTSPDGVAWTARTSGTTQALNSVIWTGRQLVVVGDGGTIRTSPDGVTWTARTSGVTFQLKSVVWTGNQLVVTGANNVVLTSPDGATWTSRASGTANALNSVTWTGLQLVAVGNVGTIMTSPDGITWTSRGSAGTTTPWYGVIWAGPLAGSGSLVAVGLSGGIRTSRDGVTWGGQFSGTSQGLNSVTWNGSLFVAVGNNGVILTSPLDVAPSPPTLIAPAQNATGVAISTSLTWNASSGAATYRVQVSTDSTFTTTAVNDSTLTATTRAIGPLTNNTIYYWRVNAKNAVGTSAYSTRGSFTTAASTAILPKASKLPKEIMPERVKLSGESLRLGLPQKAHVAIRLFNSQGRMVSQLLDETREAGYHSIPLSTKPGGSYYLLDVRAGAFHKTMKVQP